MDNRIKFLLILLAGIAMFVAGSVIVIDGLLHDFLILGGTVVFLVGLVGGIGSLRKKNTAK